jgi:hypothetical protein
MASLALESFIDESIERSKKGGYHPTTFIAMRERHGTIEAIARLVQNGDMQSGFKRLSRMGLVDWTIEAAVLKFPSEFSPVVRDCAAFRLEAVKKGI